MECGASQMVFLALFVIFEMTVRVRAQGVPVIGKEEAVMEFAESWKMEIVSWTEDIIRECFYTIRQTDQIHGTLQGDVRFIIGIAMGRMYQIHRQQVEMYRRMKRTVENKFHFIKEDMHQVYHPPKGKPYVDFKPNVFINALEFITKKEIDIEHIVKVINTYITEDEMAAVKPKDLPVSMWPEWEWTQYTTKNPSMRREGRDQEEHMKEEKLKAKMRAEYYKKHKNN